jgi:16S rRNA (guanine966-N2)-methyltransferase
VRVISGKFKRKKILTPVDNHIRPTADKQREALFHILAHWVIDADVLDLFAGTGAMGIEALSRGAKAVTFIDKNTRLIKKNINHFNVQCKTNVIQWDIFRNLRCIRGQLFDLILIDPPYHHDHVGKTLSHIAKIQCFHENTIIVAEHACDENIVLPDKFKQLDCRRYGKTQFSFFDIH